MTTYPKTLRSTNAREIAAEMMGGRIPFGWEMESYESYGIQRFVVKDPAKSISMMLVFGSDGKLTEIHTPVFNERADPTGFINVQRYTYQGYVEAGAAVKRRIGDKGFLSWGDVIEGKSHVGQQVVQSASR